MRNLRNFWDNVFINEDNPDACWLWIGVRNVGDGYGYWHGESRYWRSHRYSYITIYQHNTTQGILHKCNNKICVNPNHLYAGTPSDNAKDCVRAGTHLKAKNTHCPNGHEFIVETTRIRKLDGARECRLCDKSRKRIERASF